MSYAYNVLFRRSCIKSSSIIYQNPSLKPQFLIPLFSSQYTTSNQNHINSSNGYDYFFKKFSGSSSVWYDSFKITSWSFSRNVRWFSSQAAAEPSTGDGLTVEGIISHQWPIFEESESDWKSHASSIAQSIHLIKKRLKVTQPLPV